jgi:hypothetical protein
MKLLKVMVVGLFATVLLAAPVMAADECVQQCIETGMECQQACDEDDEECITACQDEGAACSDDC